MAKANSSKSGRKGDGKAARKAKKDPYHGIPYDQRETVKVCLAVRRAQGHKATPQSMYGEMLENDKARKAEEKRQREEDDAPSLDYVILDIKKAESICLALTDATENDFTGAAEAAWDILRESVEKLTAIHEAHLAEGRAAKAQAEAGKAVAA